MEEAIKDRIQKIMDAEQLSAAKFADTVGVQRSLVSHILNERNKPGTDIIIKILKTFPRLSADWLFLGVGAMYKNEKQAYNLSLFDENASTQSITPQEDIPPTKSQIPIEITPQMPISTAVSAKKIEKIIVYYSDTTFEEFSSTKKSI
jgi:transcriptional regulator with XRE-family HTH domain